MGRYIGFIDNLAKSKKSLLRLIFNSCSSDQSSLTGQNLAFFLLKYGKESIKELTMDKQSIKTARIYPLHRDEFWKAIIIEEIVTAQLNLSSSWEWQSNQLDHHHPTHPPTHLNF